MKKTLRLKDIAEINLFSLLWKALLQWKVMLSFAVIIGILLSSAVYIFSYLEFNSSKSLSLEDESYYISSLSSSQQSDVITACSIYEALSEDTEYLNNSILLSLNPYELNSYNIYYHVSANSASLYKTFLSGDSISGLIGELIAPGTPLNYAKELISVSFSDNVSFSTDTAGGTIIKYSVILPKTIDTSGILSTIDSQLSVFNTQVSATVGAYSFNRVMAEQSTYLDAELAKARQELLQNISIAKTNLQKLLDSFSRDQMGYYNHILSNQASLSGSVDILEASLKEPDISLFYFIIGILAGIIFYILMLFIGCLRSPSVTTSTELENSVDIKSFGEIREFHTDGGFSALKNDRFLYQQKYKKSLNSAKQIRQISDNIYLYFKEHNIDSASLVAVNTLVDKNDEYISEIIKALDESYIILQDAISVEEGTLPTLSENDNIILILISGKSRYKDIGRLLTKCRDLHVKIVGSILLDC